MTSVQRRPLFFTSKTLIKKDETLWSRGMVHKFAITWALCSCHVELKTCFIYVTPSFELIKYFLKVPRLIVFCHKKGVVYKLLYLFSTAIRRECFICVVECKVPESVYISTNIFLLYLHPPQPAELWTTRVRVNKLHPQTKRISSFIWRDKQLQQFRQGKCVVNEWMNECLT